jgi:hypothetical protein
MTAAAPGEALDAQPTGDAALRLRYLAEVSGLLWPAPARAGFGVTGGTLIADYLLVLGAKRPRLLVPGGDRRAAAAAVRRYAEPGSGRQRLMLRGLAAALSSGFGGAVLGPRFRVCADEAPDGGIGTIETYLRRALGQPATPDGPGGDLVLSLSIGPARANRKPVLQVLTPRGRTVGFAKLGVNELTRTLVRAESVALRTLAAAAPRHLTVPAVLHHGAWNGLEVLVQSPLPVWRRRAAHRPERLGEAMLEVARIGGIGTARLRDSTYWLGLGDRLDGLGADDGGRGVGRALRTAYERIGERAGDVRLRFGSWHGDWTPWNMATLRDTLLVWDWERFDHGVPLGFDAIHHAFQGAVVRDGIDPEPAAARCVEEAAELLRPFGVTSAEPMAARVTALLYFTDIAVRYLADKQGEAGTRLGRPREWLPPVLAAQVERLHRG